MAKRWSWVAWSMLAIYLVSMVSAIILSVLNGNVQQDAAGQVGLALGFSAFMIVGALIVAHRPSNAIGWIFSAVALLAFTAVLAVEYATYAYVTRPGSLPGATLAAWYGSWSWFPTIALALVFTPLLFPTGRLLSPAGGRLPGWPGRRRRRSSCWPPSRPSWTRSPTIRLRTRSGSPGWRTPRTARSVRPCSSCCSFPAWRRPGRW